MSFSGPRFHPFPYKNRPISEAINAQWILLAAILAILFLGILMFILYKFGFFRRNHQYNNSVKMHTAKMDNIGSDHAKTESKYFDRQNQQLDRRGAEENASTSLLSR